MPNCFAQFCSNCSDSSVPLIDIKYRTFPKHSQLIKQWLTNAGMDEEMIDEFIPEIQKDKRGNMYRFCSSHFTPECFVGEGKKRKFIAGCVPTIFTETATPSSSGKKWLKKLKKIREGKIKVSQQKNKINLSEGSTSHSSKVDTNDATTQTGLFDLPLPESDGATCKIAKQKFIRLDHPYCIEEVVLMAAPLHASTPVSREKSTVGQTFIPMSPRVVDSPDLRRKRKLAYDVDLSFHLSDCDTPQKGDSSVNESLEDIQPEASIPDAFSLVKEKKYIVFESNLDQLLYKMRCPTEGCLSKIKKIEKQSIGTMVVVFSTCCAEHRMKLWESQPKIKHYAAGNILLSGAICISGGSYTNVKELFDLCGIQIFGKSSFNRGQNKYIFPSIDHSWQEDNANVTKDLIGKPLFLVGDGQCDSPGFSAKYSTYTFMDMFSKKIVDFELVQVSQTTSSVAMEKFGFKKCLDRLISKTFDVQFVGTDRHTGIRKLLRDEKYKNINHQFDLWHYVKNLKRKFNQNSKKKLNRPIVPWIGPILNHFYWCSRNCEGDEDMFRERWQSVLHHVIDEHVWTIGDVEHRCLHKVLSVDNPTVPWITPQTFAFHTLSAIILDPQLDKDIKHLTFFCQTGILETYHSMILKYRPKRIHYGIDSMDARTKLAALSHNHNVIRNPALTKKKDESGAEIVVARKNLEFPRGRKQWIVRNVYEKKNNDHAYVMMAKMISIVEGTITTSWRSKKIDLPKNIAPVERPETSTAVRRHMTRFPTLEH